MANNKDNPSMGGLMLTFSQLLINSLTGFQYKPLKLFHSSDIESHLYN